MKEEFDVQSNHSIYKIARLQRAQGSSVTLYSLLDVEQTMLFPQHATRCDPFVTNGLQANEGAAGPRSLAQGQHFSLFL